MDQIKKAKLNMYKYVLRFALAVINQNTLKKMKAIHNQ